MTSETPCIQICTLDPSRRLCIGCGRTVEEITRWKELGAVDRQRIMAELPDRLRALTSGTTPT